MESRAFKWQREGKRLNPFLQAERHYWLEDDHGRVLIKTTKVNGKYGYAVLYPDKKYRNSVDQWGGLDEAYRNAAVWWTKNKNTHVARFELYALNHYR